MAMKRSSYALGSKLIAKTKIPQLFHRVAYRHELTILMYHGIIRSPLAVTDWCFIDEGSFRMQIDYLKKHFEILSLSEAVEGMRHGGIKHPTAVITFDDGYQNNFDVAFPILYKEKIPATIFLATGLIDTNDTVWHCRLHSAVSKTQRPCIEWDGFECDLCTLDLKAKASAAIQENLKGLPHSQLMATVRSIILKLGGDPDYPVEIGSPFRMLSQRAILEMASSGLIEFGAHTHHHAILSRLSSVEQLNEIRRSVDAIHDLTGRPCKCFAYPNGRSNDYDSETTKHLEACGIQMAVTTIAGPNHTTTSAMELRRYGVGTGLAAAEFQLMAHHFISKVHTSSELVLRRMR